MECRGNPTPNGDAISSVFVPSNRAAPLTASGTAWFRWVISDAIKSSLVEIDSTGMIVARSANQLFGKIAEQWGSSGGANGSSGLGSRTDYAGHDRQTDSGLDYMNAR